MIRHRTVFVAGPYAAATATEIEHHVRRALALGQLAVRRGLAPIVPHAQGWLGVYGPPDESAPETRERALRCSTELAATVARAGGELWAIRRPDGVLSDGTAAEVHAFSAAWWFETCVGRNATPSPVTLRTWDEWFPDLLAAGVELPAELGRVA